ncbi:hydroxypyruvate isomerase family protein [Alkalihalobacterium chitinilyticum]|uniref:Hydroxypyruvate isomerase family protein n=1 Tax=Alkalihalobacterium chitinilyticum TaxID=2980103 RepID=A0ABT5VG38_9BACI|nr:hydroxypyruvate isomerase family protein [Alkalihalobacterium chitinilyticum]MDE5414423.1 hydroxypyruvate isomerase family protein [Alkalihalobacterium chitinilyticum]
MFQFAVNLSTVFTEVPFLERFTKAKEADFSYVECQFPYSFSIEDIKKELNQHQLSLVLMNLPPGNWEKGDRGLAVDPSMMTEFREGVEDGIKYAKALGCSKIHCMAGVLPEGLERAVAKKTYLDNIQYAASRFEKHQLTLLIEPINSFDMPGYFLSNIEEAVNVLREVDLPNVKLQYDFYHQQRIQAGSLISAFEKYKNHIGHVQIADVPGRHEPRTGEIDYELVFKSLDNLQYQGFVGLEYTPKGKSEDSFVWMRRNGK